MNFISKTCMDTKIKLFQMQIVIKFEIPTILKKNNIKIKFVISSY